MYLQDSFFDLSMWGRTGLVCLSATLFIILLFLTKTLLQNRPFWIQLPGALIIFYLFVWTSPQIYYQYYHLLFEDLPHQWVIWPPESPLTALSYLFFQGPQNLSAHSQGLLGWALLIAPFVRTPFLFGNKLSDR